MGGREVKKKAIGKRYRCVLGSELSEIQLEIVGLTDVHWLIIFSFLTLQGCKVFIQK
jgi:hypothetical protein